MFGHCEHDPVRRQSGRRDGADYLESLAYYDCPPRCAQHVLNRRLASFRAQMSKSWSVEYPSEVIAAGGEVITASVSGSVTATALVTNTSGSLANMTLQWDHDVTMLPAIDSTSPQAVQTSGSEIIEDSVRQELLAGAVQYRARLPASSVLGVAVSSSISFVCTEMGCIACPVSKRVCVDAVTLLF